MASDEDLTRAAEEARTLAAALPDDIGVMTGMHYDFYKSWLSQGFTASQALWLTGQVVVAGFGGFAPPIGDDS